MGDIVFRPGDPAYDLIVIESGRIEIVSPSTHDESEAPIASYGAGGFLGELNLLTGQTAYLTARVVAAGTIHRIAPDRFRRLMADDPEVSDLLLRTFLWRRDHLRDSPAARSIEIVGSGMSAEALALRTFAARQRLPHVWLDIDTLPGRALMSLVPLAAADLPAVVLRDRVLRRAGPSGLAQALGLSYRSAPARTLHDLTIIGSGPAGLAAAVSGASEGLRTIVVDMVGIGGQAAASSRIENYVGFPSGISGYDLTQRAALQAMKFGAELRSPGQVDGIYPVDGHLSVRFTDGTGIDTRTAVIATGARYRSLPVPGWADFEGAGIYYAATEIEAQACSGQPVVVVGGANSAGQAALFLAKRGCSVTLVVRGSDIEAGMSAYLVDRLRHDPRVEIQVNAQVVGVAGATVLEAITLASSGAEVSERRCAALFCFIGAEPATSWQSGVVVDRGGFILTGSQLTPTDLPPVWAALGRRPLPFETSAPGVFAAGDVRVGSMRRVAAAVGEGASVIRSVHEVIGVRI
ncbi:FAD-dependent oxidoreductase [Pedococcus sp. KACC 23699]|uniref:FAD-dependent oxidoreductase n=1 Tax=Pedococcus sp. KACC 23699 TaxID=3149228 RepID=A0AAU7JVY5_9MICO